MILYIWLIIGITVRAVSPKPTATKHQEPCADPLNCLHGVLMHGDDEAGKSHDAEDNYLKFKSALDTGPKEKLGPNDAEDTFHGALMHDGKEFDATHNDVKVNQPMKEPDSFGPKDTNTMMHDVMHGDTEKGHDHTHDKKSENENVTAESQSPPDAEKMMHDILMHGDNKTENHHVHSRPEDEDAKAKGPKDQSSLMHDLMHNGEHVDHSSETANDEHKSPSGPNSDALHGILMHGDSEIGHDHEEEHKNSKTVPFKFDIDKIKELGIDPDLIKQVFPDDADDFKKWQEEKKSKTDDDFYKATYASISDSMLSDIEAMKKRYLAQEVVEPIEVELTGEDFVADKVVNVIENFNHDDNDMMHDLELIGSTEPINEIHKKHKDHKQKQEM